MNDQEINIAIAEACGWDMDPAGCREWTSRGKWCANPRGKLTFKHNVPKYTTDLNAIHLACETTLGGSNAWTYFIGHLCEVTQTINCSEHDALVITNRATASQRAEAFLRTIGKWKEEE